MARPVEDDAPTTEPPKPQTVQTKYLRPNPHNPRMLFDEVDMKPLEASIRKVGILVPITVFRAAGSKRYTILDGQRRWHCAERLNLPTVPINEVAEPSLTQNIVTMFQIHKLRKDWELMPTALKLEVLMVEMKERNETILADLTGLDPAVVSRCKKLLSFEPEYQDMMLQAEPEDRVRADFFIELYPILNDREVVKAKWYDRDFVISGFLRKYQERLSGIRSIVDFRKIKSHISAAKKADRVPDVLTRLREFLKSDDLEIDHLEIDTARIHKEAASLLRTVSKLSTSIADMDPDEFSGEEELWESLEELYLTTKNKLLSADRRLPK